VSNNGDNMLSKRDASLTPVPPKYREIFRRAYGGKARKDAIRANCLECMNFSEKDIADCAIEHCPLHLYRLGPVPRNKVGGSEITQCDAGEDTPEGVENARPPIKVGGKAV